MNSIILTDYKNIKRTLAMCRQFNEKINEKIAYIIVDNSGEGCGKKYLVDNVIRYSQSLFNKKQVYLFQYNGLDVTIIDNNGNFGYAVGNNVGAKYAKLVYHSSYYIFSNSDLEFPYEIDLTRISEVFSQNPDVGIIGPCIMFKGRDRQNPRLFRSIVSQMILGDFNSRWFHCKFNKQFNCLDQNPVEGPTDWVVGCFLITSAKKFEVINGFDENTFLYAEEMIISKRMLRNGYKTYYLPTITIIHDHQGVDTRKLRKVLHTSLKYYYKEYENTNGFLLALSDCSFYVTEIVYYLYHDLVKEKILRILKR